MEKLCPFFLSLVLLLISAPIQAKGKKTFRYDKNEITARKSLDEAYARFGKIYKPYDSGHSNLDLKTAKQLERLFTLTDMAVIEKVILLEVIGKIDQHELARDTIHIDYYDEILGEMEKLRIKDKRLIKVRKDLIKGINHHREVLDAWLMAARKDRVYKVKNASGHWVHPGTSAGDKIFYSLYHSYIITNFKAEYPENLKALSRHLCVLVF
ncbi:MAG: hypothetical protein HN576_11450 [Bacteriovoracaceae bacterium]|jgi:hypothetical protein|nr:hypothetical protein [Bacteriovoracaceae bacterium]